MIASFGDLVMPRLFALLAIPAIILLTGPAIAQSRGFSDWTANCAPDLYCTTQTPGPNGSLLRLERYANGVYWQLSVELPPEAYLEPYEPVTIAIDGVETRLESRDAVGAYGRPQDVHFLGEEAQATLDAMIDGTSAVIAWTPIGGTETRSLAFPLAGLSAGLLWIDEQQRRLGSERVTGEPPYGLAPVDGPTEWTIAIPPELIERHRADEDCEAFEWLPNGLDITADRLDSETGIVSLPCNAGAYNFSSKFYRLDGAEITKLDFATYSDYGSRQATDQLVNAWFDPKSGEIGMFNKGRGIADCGSSAIWRRTGGFFRLEEFRHKDECDAEGEPGDFPLVFSAPPLAEQ
jgi:hypothetical protein